MEMEHVRELQREGRLRKVLADMPAVDDDTGEYVHFDMEGEILSTKVEGPFGFAMVFWQDDEGVVDELGNITEL